VLIGAAINAAVEETVDDARWGDPVAVE
jgi:hypothetical protein